MGIHFFALYMQRQIKYPLKPPTVFLNPIKKEGRSNLLSGVEIPPKRALNYVSVC